MKTPSDRSIGSVREGLISRTDLTGSALRAALTAAYDDWLAALLPQNPAIALIAVGGLGRKEPTTHSDLDLVLLHDGKAGKVGSIADELWYPIWDSGVGLDHSVRTVDEAVTVASQDIKAMLGLLDARHIAGNAELSSALRERIVSGWRNSVHRRLPELQELARGRWSMRGDASFLLEPDLKDCRGGLRDWVGLRALASAQLLDLVPAVVAASAVLLDVRGELHRLVGRGTDVLRAQDRDAVAGALGLTLEPELGIDQLGDVALRNVNEAARAIAYATDAAWRRVDVSTASGSRTWLRRLRPTTAAADVRVPLAQDVVAQHGEVVLARDARPGADPVLVLRVARAAAEHDLPISNYTLNRLAADSAPMPDPWPAPARNEFVALLGAGRRSVRALEALDQVGLLSRLIPEWAHVRYRAQHNAVHVFTVDRHLIETAVQASSLAAEVARPDLLILGALLHDIGKGRPGDHSVVGAELATAISRRMGFEPTDVDLIVGQVRHHLLLPDTATRRDLDDPSTIALVLAAIDRSTELLELLGVLTVADAAATGPAAWSDWKASLVRQLVGRCRRIIGGDPMPEPTPLPEHLAALAGSGRTQLVIEGSEVIVVAPDAPGLLSRASGLLAMHSLDVRAADVRTVQSVAVNSFTVSPRFGEFPDAAVLNADLRRILSGSLDLSDRLHAKEQRYEAGHGAVQAGADDLRDGGSRVLWFDDEATDASVFEVRTRDGIGLLHRLTGALEEAGLDIRSARISSLGSYVVDAFYVTDSNGKPPDATLQNDVTARVTELLASR